MPDFDTPVVAELAALGLPMPQDGLRTGHMTLRALEPVHGIRSGTLPRRRRPSLPGLVVADLPVAAERLAVAPLAFPQLERHWELTPV